jgi:prepilin-type processing-associated H-X9-DG protein
MNANKGLTRVDAIITVACVALVLAQAAVLNAGGRERSKREVCLANLRMLANAWQTYSSDNNSKVPCGDVYYSWGFPPSSGGPQRAWVEWPHRWPHSMPPTATTNQAGAYSYSSSITQADWEHAITEGTMWKYVGDYNIYRCPDGDKNAYVSYSMSMSMPAYPGAGGPGSISRMITNINQIIQPAERFVFLDAGVAKQGAFYLNYNSPGGAAPPGSFGDHRPTRHGRGTTFAFADGHAIYRKWIFATDTASVETGGWGGTSQPCDCDWRWFCKVTWGDVPLNCTNPAKNCEY